MHRGVGDRFSRWPASAAPESARTANLALTAGDVIPTGNDWIALPAIRASDGALQNFNVISMRYRGLLEIAGVADRPLMTPSIEIAGVPPAARSLAMVLA